jgi:stress response protein YsnF
MIGSCDLPTPLPDVRRVPSWLALLARSDVRSDVANDVEVTLRAERPVVATEAIPVERVRLGTETVRDEETVSGEVHKEQIELDDDSGTGPRDNRR